MPYPAETEIIANVVTSPHHLSATMVDGRVHRMTELFGRLAPGADLEAARAELRTVHASMVNEHPEAYSPKADFRIEAVQLRDQITSPREDGAARAARGLGAGVRHRLLERRQPDSRAHRSGAKGELAIRAALGAGTGALRRTLLAESLLLCGAGAILGVADRPADGRRARAVRRRASRCARWT